MEKSFNPELCLGTKEIDSNQNNLIQKIKSFQLIKFVFVRKIMIEKTQILSKCVT